MDTPGQNEIQALTEEAFESLFKTHFKELCFFAQRYVKDIETARELVQESFVALWEKRLNIDVSKSVRAYLGSSVYNKCLNYLRDNKKFNKDILAAEQLYPMNNKHESDILVFKEIKNKIDNSIDELPEKCKEIFVLSRYENLKYHEIADKLNISVKTVESQMSKALQHLRYRLAEFLTLLILLLFNKG